MPRKDQSHHSLPPAQNLPPTAPDPDPKQEQEPTVSAKNSDSSTSQKKSFINALLSEDEDEETMLLFAQMKDLRDRLRDFMGIEDFYESLTCTIDMLSAVQAEKDDFDEAEEDPTSQSKQEGDPSPESNGDEDVSNRGLNEGVKTSDGAPKARETPRRSPRLNSFDVKAYTFTGVKDASIEFYGRTGIDEVFADISEETLCLVIKHPNYDKELDSFWDRRSVDGLIGPLERSTTFVAPVPESGCRWSTLDRVADHVMWGLSECQILPAAFTELSVTRGNEEGEKGSKTAVIIWRKNKTILTGRYDYLFLTIPQDPRYPKFSGES
ncbi:hypothetical protein BDN72DRAFT_488580 [Pluteus cervinus]|uniref:Uncharacterized protein n=1 Tax=Pluteus cervinus TaxID=181527 RepID=A0ACD3A5K0_9AGAR|nr:hypothetical protein BDN72DRAFT_488580 [Pluteus cervinus]